MRRVLLGVTASIACYKSAELCRQIYNRGIDIRVILTPTATRLVTPTTFRALSHHPVTVDEWDYPQSSHGMDHIEMTRTSDYFIVAPASADFIAKAAAGIADNLLLTTFLAASCPRAIAPAMNQQMWKAAATQRNIQRLIADGVTILGPDSGEQACGENGEGRMMTPEDLIQHIMGLENQLFSDQKVVISTGATAEPIDDMRIITNKSSGKMGFSLATAIHDMGAKTKIIAARTSASIPQNIPLRRETSNKAMLNALLEETKDADWFFSVAAIADFSPIKTASKKINREQGNLSLTFSPTTDILMTVASTYPQLRCLGFAAQSGDNKEAEARKKMQRKGISYLVVNDVNDADKEDCQLTLLHPNGTTPLPRLPKEQAAKALLLSLHAVSRET